MDWSQLFDKVVNETSSEMDLERLEEVSSLAWEQRLICDLRRYIDEYSLSPEQITMLKQQCVECEKFYQNNLKQRDYHFGYPANMLVRTPLYYVFSEYERYGFLANNCGDTFEKGNYAMDSKDIEQSILRMFAEKFGIDTSTYWGYITSGGSESNAWGISRGFQLYPNGVLYYCESAHYSIRKYASGHRSICIPQVSAIDESINCNILLEMIRVNPEPVILILTWGSTKFGSCDDIVRIVQMLKKEQREYYLHVDAALYGGIPNNQREAPVISQIDKMGIHSISVSLHKYIGVPSVKSVLLSIQKPEAEVISYIGMEDSTTAGSRDILPFSTRQQVFDVLKLSKPEEYRKNIVLFENLLKENGIPYIRSGKGNIFVLDKPAESICKKYQLSTFDICNGGIKEQKAHIIIFPYQSEETICELIRDLREIV